MKNPPSPSFSITPSIFGLLKSLDLTSVDLNPNMTTLVPPITGWEIMVYDPVVAEPRFRENKCLNWLKSVMNQKRRKLEKT